MGGVRTGLDVLRAEGFAQLRGRRLGVLCNPASVDGEYRHILDLLRQAGVAPRLVFGPEHGWQGAAQDMEPVPSEPPGDHGVRVVSLYGSSVSNLQPEPETLTEIDLLLVDLQDVGCRYYTFASSLRGCMEACGQAGVTVMVCDRPNPLGGSLLEGPLLEDGLRSFVGGYRVPVRHGLTLGELARLACIEGVDVELEIVRLLGWGREMWFDQTALPWVMPSPNMPTLDTVGVYPGACLIESTELSEGRGTTRPFEMLGAPWLDGFRLARDLAACGVEGATLRPTSFRPAFHKHTGQICHGVQLHVTDRQRFQPFLTGALLLQVARNQQPEKFCWRKQAYEFDARPALDLLAGTSDLRLAIEQGVDVRPFSENWKRDLARFARARREWLLYPEETS